MADIIERDGFQLSRNAYDWLGDGVYFFQDGPLRAWQWAREQHEDDAAVIGADIRLVDCMDMLDLSWVDVLRDAYDEIVSQLEEEGQAIPRQSAGAHPLDRDVINYAVSVLEDSGTHISCVRSVFQEGQPIYPGSALYALSHVQIDVRDTETCIRRIWRASRGR